MYFSFERAIANLNPKKTKTDPTTNFWTVYKEVADEYDNDMTSKCVQDLDASLLFVSTWTSLLLSTLLNHVLPLR